MVIYISCDSVSYIPPKCAKTSVAVLWIRKLFSHNNEYHSTYLLQEQTSNP